LIDNRVLFHILPVFYVPVKGDPSAFRQHVSCGNNKLSYR